MRRLVFSLISVIVVLALTASTASSITKKHASARPSAVLCGGLYKPPCTAPTVIARSIVACKNTGTTLVFPASVHAIAGLRSATVKLGNKTIKTVKFSGSPTNGSFSFTVNTRGDRPGIYTATVKVTDTRGKTATKVVHFSICKPKPVFTG